MELREEALKGDGKAVLPNGEPIDFKESDAIELATSAYINENLRGKADEK